MAAKTTNHPIALETYTGHIPGTSPNDVLELEFLLAQSLSFEFAVWHAHRSMWGLWLDLQVSLSPSLIELADKLLRHYPTLDQKLSKISITQL